jgi:hypothetical protein
MLTDAMSNERSVSVSNIYPLLLHMKKICDTPVTLQDGDSPPEVENVETMGTEIRRDLWQYVS